MHDIMSQARGNLTGFPELYSNGHLIFEFFSSFLSTASFLKQIRTRKKTLSILMGLKGGDCVTKAGVKIEQCKNPLGSAGQSTIFPQRGGLFECRQLKNEAYISGLFWV